MQTLYADLSMSVTLAAYARRGLMNTEVYGLIYAVGFVRVTGFKGNGAPGGEGGFDHVRTLTTRSVSATYIYV